MKVIKTYWVRTLFTLGLLLICGFASSYVFHLGEDVKFTSLFPGLFYTSTTIFIFLLTKATFKIINLLIYYSLMYVAYLAVFFLTFLSSSMGFLVGIFTTGFGAVVTFLLTSRYIKKIDFNQGSVFIAGGLAFIINDIFLFTPLSTLIEPIYEMKGWIHTVFAGTFLLWQVFVGMKLFFTLQKE